MKLSLHWLQDYIEITETPEQLAELITLHIAEVEHIEHQANNLHDVVVGKIISVRSHPNANKLRLCDVDYGNGHQQIVCGGSNLAVDQLVVVAKPGAQVHWHGQTDLMTLTTTTIRGEQSVGMICAAEELGLEHIFPAETEKEIIDLHTLSNSTTLSVGSSIAESLGLTDVIIEIENKTLTHRADLFNHIGFARELSVVLKRPCKLPALLEQAGADRLPYFVNITEPNACQRYFGVVLDGVTIKPSPGWLQQRLRAVGIKPINNAVDITNYVMMDYGQPLHVFDYAKLSGHTINVRRAKPDERLLCLDGKNRVLDESTLVIADDTKPCAIAGIIGGETSAINEFTTTIALESAHFSGSSIRQTAHQFGLRTEASVRHEKNLGDTFTTWGLWRALALLQELAGAKIASNIQQVGDVVETIQLVTIRHDFICRYLGTTINTTEVERILTGLGFTVTLNMTTDTYQIKVPTWRTDITGQQDIVEEVARIYGYDALPATPLRSELKPPEREAEMECGERIIGMLAGLGCTEVYHYSYYSEQDINKLGLTVANHHEVINPMNPEQRYLRCSFLPGLLRAIANNQRQGYRSIQLMEYGHLYTLSAETKHVAGVVFQTDSDGFTQAKAIVEECLRQLHVLPQMHYSEQQVMYLVNHAVVATVELITETVRTAYDVPSACSYFLLNLAPMVVSADKSYQFKPISQFPAIDLDISIAIDETISWDNLEGCIRKAAGPLLTAITVFDVFRGGDIPANQKALGIRFRLQSLERTLLMSEAEQIRATILTELSKHYSITHRY